MAAGFIFTSTFILWRVAGDCVFYPDNNNGIIYNWIELLAYLACKNGGDFKSFKKSNSSFISMGLGGSCLSSL